MHNNNVRWYNLWDPLSWDKACSFDNRQSRPRQLVYKFDLNRGRHDFLQSKYNTAN